MSRTRPRLRPRYRWVIAACVAIPALITAPWMVVRTLTADSTQRVDTTEAAVALDHADYALVLGARVHEDGRPSRFLRERVQVGVDLYHAGVVDRLLMSGDGHDSSGFGETAVMREVAESLGVPAEDIVEDPMGLDTYSSCVRARDRYGASSVVVATQEFHLSRAVWVCKQAGLAAQGAHPSVRITKSTVYGHVREVGAVAKVMIDVARGRQPEG
jgi:vancomycin permeability regulator SanA